MPRTNWREGEHARGSDACAPHGPECPRVLVVDDVPANLLALEVLLEGLPCQVQVAHSGLEALSLLLRGTFAAMLLDVRMPGMDGYEVAQHARMHSGSRDVPIIFMTAESPTEEHLKLGYDAGAVDFLFKPVSREILRGKVGVFVELFESRRRLAQSNVRLEAANSKLLSLMDEQETATRALRQANDELNAALSELRARKSPPFPRASSGAERTSAGAALPREVGQVKLEDEAPRSSGVHWRVESDRRSDARAHRRRTSR